eukprot:15339654-Ditylum_brightwellii.AAC.4
MMPHKGDQLEPDKSEVSQQPNYAKPYPSNLTVKWKQHRKTKLAIVIGPAGKDSPYLHLVTIGSPDPVYIPQHSTDIYPNALESLISKEDLEKLWHTDQVTLSDDL